MDFTVKHTCHIRTHRHSAIRYGTSVPSRYATVGRTVALVLYLMYLQYRGHLMYSNILSYSTVQ